MELKNNLFLSISSKDVGLALIEILILAVLLSFVYGIACLFFKQVKRVFCFKNKVEEPEFLYKHLKIALLFSFASGALGIVGYNLYLLYNNRDLILYTKQKLELISPDFWKICGIGVLKITALFICSVFIVKFVVQLLQSLKEKAKAYKRITANNESIEVFFNSFSVIARNSIRILTLIYSVKFLPFPPALSAGIFVFLKVYLIISLGVLLVFGISVITDSLDELSKNANPKDRFFHLYQRLSVLMPLFKRCLEYITYIFVATLVMLQVKFFSNLAVYGQRIGQLIGIFFLCRITIEATNIFVDKALLPLKKGSAFDRQKQMTLSPLIKSFFKYLLCFLGAVFALKAININPSTIIAGAGIIGIVFGLGAQPLINDLVTGFFILFENLYLVGDFIETGDAKGVVEAVDIRTSRIRNPNGQLHILRNGQLNDVINFSKSYTYAVVEVGVAFDSDLDLVYKVISDAGIEFSKIENDILEPTNVQGLEDFGNSQLLIRTITKVKPGCHLDVARKLRKVIKEAFDREHIEIPFPRRVVILKKDEDKNLLSEAFLLNRNS